MAARVIKEYVELRDGYRFILREDNYDKRLSKFQNLFEVAWYDFPNLKPDQVEIVQYGGERYKRTMGIEFTVQVDTIPEGYEKRPQVELTL